MCLDESKQGEQRRLPMHAVVAHPVALATKISSSKQKSPLHALPFESTGALWYTITLDPARLKPYDLEPIVH